MRSAFYKPMLILLALLLLTACAPTNGKHGATPSPYVTEAPEVEYTMQHYVRYWPEDADYNTCDYACVSDVPEFSKAYTYGYAMNAAVDAYLDELAARIENEYIAHSVAEPPYTEVGCIVEHCGKYTNIIFSEHHCYEAQPYNETHVLMLDETGRELDLCDVLLDYHAEDRVIARILEMISADAHYPAADAEKVRASIDIRHGARVTENGCTVFVHEGLLAPYDDGELAFELLYKDLCPAFVGSAIDETEFRSLTEFFGLVLNAVIVRGEEIQEGRLSPYAATAFMAQAAGRFGLVPKAGRIRIPAADFEAYYRKCFMNEFPGIDTDARGIKLEEGVYSVPAAKLEYSYHADMAEVTASGDSVTVKGDVVFGEFGYAYSDFVCHFTAELERSEGSPFGFILHSLDLGL